MFRCRYNFLKKNGVYFSLTIEEYIENYEDIDFYYEMPKIIFTHHKMHDA